MGWTQFVRNLLWGFIFIGFFWLFSESSHIWNSWLLLSWVLSCWRCLSVCRWLALRSWWCAFLALRGFFWLFLLWLLVFRRNRVQYSWRFDLFLIFSKGSDINCFSLIFLESLSWVLQFVMQGPPMSSIWLYDSFDVIKRDVKPLLDFLNFFFLWMLDGISVLFAHLISDFSLILALLDESKLFFEP